MAFRVEVSGYFVFQLFVFDKIEMTLETCFHTVHSLVDILFPTFLAGDTINQVVARTVNVFHGCICSASRV